MFSKSLKNTLIFSSKLSLPSVGQTEKSCVILRELPKRIKMNTTLQAALIQTDIAWENPEKNRLLLAEKIAALPSNTDLIVLPEMFSTGFSMQPASVAEPMDGTTLAWMKTQAKEKNAAITGSIVIKEGSTEPSYHNRLLFVYPNGEVAYYDKKHSFTLAGEEKVYTAGNERKVIKYKGWRICPLICYDLRFPVWSRNTEHYDLLLYVASWPTIRVQAWDSLLKARAIENLSYTIGVNRIGLDGNNFDYSGNSACYNALGDQLAYDNSGTATTLLVALDKNSQDELRKKLNFLADRDAFTLT
jgi:predicted amidohydrolase